jgi:hypothetical protein
MNLIKHHSTIIRYFSQTIEKIEHLDKILEIVIV